MAPSHRTQAPGTFEMKPAFEYTYIFDPKRERRHGAIKWHSRVPQSLQKAHEFFGSRDPRHLPMLVVLTRVFRRLRVVLSRISPSCRCRHDRGHSLTKAAICCWTASSCAVAMDRSDPPERRREHPHA